jgi:hypothetical protein
VSLFHFSNDLANAQACADAVEDFLTGVLARVNNQNGATINTSVADIDPFDGTLLFLTAISSPGRQVGALTDTPLPPVVQGLLRLGTDGIRNNRVIRGRLFLPGLCEQDNDASGTPSAFLVNAMTVNGDALMNDLTANWAVWSRPSPISGDGGIASPVSSTAFADTWAVLRSRRD